MTRPNATNVNPALRARISAILAAYAADPVADVLATVAEAFAVEWRSRGLSRHTTEMAVVTMAAHSNAARLLGRPLLPDEATALEACIRAHLETT